MIIKRNKSKMCLSRRPKNRKMSPTTKTVNCHSFTYLSYWRLLDTFHRYLSFLMLTLRYYSFTNYTVGRSIQWVGGGFIKFVTLLQFYKLSMFPYFVVLDTNYDSITSLLATQILYFGPLRGSGVTLKALPRSRPSAAKSRP